MADDAGAHFERANDLKRSGRFSEAIGTYEQAIAIRPDFVEALNNLGNTLKQVGRIGEAIDAYQRAIALRPLDVEAFFNLGNTYSAMERLGEAIAAYRQALAVRPEDADVWVNLGNALRESAQTDEAITCYRQAIQINGHPIAAGNLLYTLYLHPDASPQQILQAHRQWSERYARPLYQFIEPHRNDPSPDRRLKIGYVSNDLSMHPIGRFMLPLLAHHDRDSFEIICYASGPGDAMTPRLKSHAGLWRDTNNLSHEQLAAAVREDGIDILVDLALHTNGSRLATFARKPAPVQVTYLAYPGTSGLQTIDYRLTDGYLDPRASDEAYYTECSIRLGNYWCYAPLDEAPDIGPSPVSTSGNVTFGCFNKYNKVSSRSWEMWIEVLRQTPGSRIVVLSPQGPHRQQVLDRMSKAGVDLQRVEFVERVSLPEYFQRYHRIDIALDPFPCGGGTTTCDALWMGVPVVSLAGQTGISRAGFSILSAVGLGELVAHEPGQYVQIASSLARDRARLSELRSKLRSMMSNSPLMNAPAFAANVEGAFRQMWRAWGQSRARA